MSFDFKEVKRKFSSIEKSVLTKSEILEVLNTFDVKKVNLISSNGVTIDVKRKTASYDGEIIKLTPQQYLLLLYFIENKNVVITREEIMDKVWQSSFVDERAIDVYVCNLRKKLRKSFIETRKGFGFEWVEEED
jgi:DNA-binding response OmpR family regulator